MFRARGRAMESSPSGSGSSVCAVSALAAHLGFALSVEPQMLIPLLTRFFRRSSRVYKKRRCVHL